MVSSLSFHPRRPRRSDSGNKTATRRPPPLKLEDSFFQQKDKKKSGERAVKAVRGEAPEPKPSQGSFTIPMKMEVSLSKPSASKRSKPVEIPKASGASLQEPDRSRFAYRTPAASILADTRPVSPQESLRTIIQLDGHDSEDDHNISPLSDHRPPARTSSALSKFFPELSSNLLMASSPGEGKGRKTTGSDRPTIREESFLEDEMFMRVRTLYTQSADAASDEDDFAFSYEQKTVSSSGSDEIVDDVSSCYSRRTSITSVGTEALGADDKVYKSADAFSIMSPAAAGVFDDGASLCPSRAASRGSRARSRASSRSRRSRPESRTSVAMSPADAPPMPRRSPVEDSPVPIEPRRVPSSSHEEAFSRSFEALFTPPEPSPRASGRTLSINSSRRTNSLTPSMILEDLKNKPLPLEPVQEPGPLAIRRESGPAVERSASQYCHHQPKPRPELRHSASLNFQQPKHQCHSCGGCGDRRSGHEPRPDGSIPAPEGRRSRPGPTFSQAAEELEDTLAGLGRSATGKQQTMLILDTPLQVRRHNGEWVASRPAPTPPSSKPYSGSRANPPLESSRTVKKDKHGRPIKSKRAPEAPKDRHPSLGSNLGTIREVPNKEKGQKKMHSSEATEKKLLKSPKPHQASNPVTVEEKSKDKTKRSFITMPSFSRRASPPIRATKSEQQQQDKVAERVQRNRSVLSSQSETSLDPVPESRRLSRFSHSELELNLAAEPTASKCEDLRLQLPRLQTHNLGLQSVLEHFSFNQKTGRSLPASPTRDPADADSTHEDDLYRFMPPDDEKLSLASDKMRQNQAFVSTAQASSVLLPPDQVFELAATPPSPSLMMPELPDNNWVSTRLPFPVDMPEKVIVSMMESISSLDDLFNLVLVNKRFYNTFKAHELPMIKNALFKMSPPAWELREMSPPWDTEWQQVLDPDTRVPEYTPSLYLDRYAQDIFALAQLKSMILVRCTPFLRRDTIRGLSGVDSGRAEEVDDAFWRIWTFCRIFGMGKGRENDMEGQRDWLKGGVKAKKYLATGSSMTEPFGMNNVLFEPPQGFGCGNDDGLSPKQLYDMTEIWTCLGVLLQPLHGKCAEAREFGIFDGMDLPEDDTVREEAVLGKSKTTPSTVKTVTDLTFTEEWTSWVLTLGLSAVLTLSSLSPAEATVATFATAKEAGLTKWELTETETSRSCFLREAASRVYEDQERSLSDDTASMVELPRHGSLSREQDRERQQAFSLELRSRRLNGADPSRERATSFSDERPMSEFSTIVHNLNGTLGDAPPVPPVPALMFDRSSTSSGSTAPAPRTPNFTPPPPHSPDHSYHIPHTPRSPSLHPSLAPAPLQPQVLDPVDRAMHRLVGQLGFNEEDVKWALKITDTGEGIDGEAAEQLLKQQKKRQDRNPFAPRGKQSLLMSVMKRHGSQESGWRWAA